jgi:hypothetical protein
MVAAGVAALQRQAPPGVDERGLEADTEFDLGRYGHVTARAGSRISIDRQDDEEIRMSLHRGEIEAFITLAARPRLFQVVTPSTTCIDLGCRYTLHVDAEGRSYVHVATGRVAFAARDHEVYVPAGARCVAVPWRGTGTPYWDDAPAELVRAIRAFDEAPAAGRPELAKAVTRASGRKEDALSLWHLMLDPDARVADLGYRALVNAIGEPRGVTRERSLGRDPEALLAWKRHVIAELGLLPWD